MRPDRAAVRMAHWALLALPLAAGCSGVKPYPNTSEKNAVVHVKTDSASFFSRRQVDLGVYTVDTSKCTAHYLGNVRLENGPLELALPVGETVLLTYFFSRGNSTSAIEMMTPTRKGYRYEFEVSYVENSYGTTGVELAPGQTRGREIEHRRFRDCVSK